MTSDEAIVIRDELGKISDELIATSDEIGKRYDHDMPHKREKKLEALSGELYKLFLKAVFKTAPASKFHREERFSIVNSFMKRLVLTHLGESDDFAKIVLTKNKKEFKKLKYIG